MADCGFSVRDSSRRLLRVWNGERARPGCRFRRRAFPSAIRRGIFVAIGNIKFSAPSGRHIPSTCQMISLTELCSLSLPVLQRFQSYGLRRLRALRAKRFQTPFASFVQTKHPLQAEVFFRARNYNASENASGETPAIFSALRNVPRATSRCMGITQPRSPSGVIFLRTTWLPRWRSTKNPSFFKAFTASVPETMGSLAVR